MLELIVQSMLAGNLDSPPGELFEMQPFECAPGQHFVASSALRELYNFFINCAMFKDIIKTDLFLLFEYYNALSQNLTMY